MFAGMGMYLGSSVRSNLDASGWISERVWIGVEVSRRTPTNESTGSKHDSGEITKNSGGRVCI